MVTDNDKADDASGGTKGGLKLEALDEFKSAHQVSAVVISVADDFDAPLPEDFLIRPLPVSSR